MHIYAFGSVCRGEITQESDIDLLAIAPTFDSRIDPNVFSIYSYDRIKEIWMQGNPFAWHLAKESKIVYAIDGVDFLGSLGAPSVYSDAKDDCVKFFRIFCEARDSLLSSEHSRTYDLSSIFLSIRNFATCFSLGVLRTFNFSRYSASKMGEYSIQIPSAHLRVFERARLLCTRGIGPPIQASDLSLANSSLNEIEIWMANLLRRIEQQ